MGRSVQNKEGKCQGFTVTVTPTVAYDYYTGQSCYCLSGLDRSSHRLVPSSVTLANAYMLEKETQNNCVVFLYTIITNYQKFGSFNLNVLS